MKIRCLAKSSLAYLFIFALSIVFVSPASASLIVDFQSDVAGVDGVFIDAGGQRDISVFVRSDSGVQNLYYYDMSFLLVPVSATAGTTMTYIDPLSESYTVDAQLDPQYVFFGNSSFGNGSPGNVFDPRFSTPTIAVALDETFNSRNVVVTSEPQLLARLTVQHKLNGATPAEVGGDMFQIILGRDNINDLPFAAFDNEMNEVRVIFDPGTRGIITVTAIPEPGTFAFSSLVALGLLPIRRRRR